MKQGVRCIESSEKASFKYLLYFHILQRNNKNMEYKPNKMFSLAVKRWVPLKSLENKKLDENNLDDYYNAKKGRWMKPNTHTVYEALTERESFGDMQVERSHAVNFKSCVKFVG